VAALLAADHITLGCAAERVEQPVERPSRIRREMRVYNEPLAERDDLLVRKITPQKRRQRRRQPAQRQLRPDLREKFVNAHDYFSGGSFAP